MHQVWASDPMADAQSKVLLVGVPLSVAAGQAAQARSDCAEVRLPHVEEAHRGSADMASTDDALTPDRAVSGGDNPVSPREREQAEEIERLKRENADLRRWRTSH